MLTEREVQGWDWEREDECRSCPHRVPHTSGASPGVLKRSQGWLRFKLMNLGWWSRSKCGRGTVPLYLSAEGHPQKP